MKVNETIFDQPDVSQITPVFVPHNATRSGNYELVYINDYGRYQSTTAYWCDIEKVWCKTSSGEPINHEIVRHDGAK